MKHNTRKKKRRNNIWWLTQNIISMTFFMETFIQFYAIKKQQTRKTKHENLNSISLREKKIHLPRNKHDSKL